MPIINTTTWKLAYSGDLKFDGVRLTYRNCETTVDVADILHVGPLIWHGRWYIRLIRSMIVMSCSLALAILSLAYFNGFDIEQMDRWSRSNKEAFTDFLLWAWILGLMLIGAGWCFYDFLTSETRSVIWNIELRSGHHFVITCPAPEGDWREWRELPDRLRFAVDMYKASGVTVASPDTAAVIHNSEQGVPPNGA